MEKTTIALTEKINLSLKETDCSQEDIYTSKDGSWALVIATSSPDPMFGVSRSLLIIFKDNEEQPGALYNMVFQGEDFYYANHELAKIKKVDEQQSKVVVELLTASNKEIAITFDL